MNPSEVKSSNSLGRERPSSHSYFSQRLRLHYLDWGNDDAPPLLCIHGIHDHCRSWDWVVEYLKEDYHVIAVDLRGHGDSEWAMGSSYMLIEYVYDIAQLITQQQLAPLTILSHSLGGTIAAMYSGLYPDSVSDLVIIEGVGLYPFSAGMSASSKIRHWIDSGRAMSSRTVRRYPSFDAANERMNTMNPHLSREQAQHLAGHGSNQNEDGTYSWKFDNYTRLRSPYDMPRDDMIELWQQIEADTLIVNSTEGYPHRIGQDGTDRYFKNLQFVEVEQAGHWSHHDQLDTVINHLRSFLFRTDSSCQQS